MDTLINLFLCMIPAGVFSGFVLLGDFIFNIYYTLKGKPDEYYDTWDE